MLLLDTSGLLSALFPDQQRHDACAQVVLKAKPPLILSPFVLAELDYLIGTLSSVKAQLNLLDDIVQRSYKLVPFGREDIETARGIIARYADLRIGLADASIAVLSRRFQTRDLLSLDERDFRVLRAFDGEPFRILPADLT